MSRHRPLPLLRSSNRLRISNASSSWPNSGMSSAASSANLVDLRCSAPITSPAASQASALSPPPITSPHRSIHGAISPRPISPSARAPYFANGSAGDLAELVDFFDRRFKIGLTDKEKQDLVHFLSIL